MSGKSAKLVRGRFVCHGGVQGVGFRYTACDAARRLGVAGWVRNLPDGTVEAVAEGSPAAVAAFAAWCRQGPSMARVTRVQECYADITAIMSGFEIRY